MAKCATCGKDLGLMTHRYKVDGQLYCDDDYKTIQAAKLTEVNDEKLEELKAKGKAIFTVDMTDEELRDGINKSLVDIARQEAGSGWAKMGSLLSGSSTDQLQTLMLKAL